MMIERKQSKQGLSLEEEEGVRRGNGCNSNNNTPWKN